MSPTSSYGTDNNNNNMDLSVAESIYNNDNETSIPPNHTVFMHNIINAQLQVPMIILCRYRPAIKPGSLNPCGRCSEEEYYNQLLRVSIGPPVISHV